MLIDIRSDTVTQPTPEMRKAMAQAEVGDDVYGDDPTVNRLESLAARMLGKEAALFVPSGTFGNQLALFTWCERGTEVILGDGCHITVHEAGAPSVIAGVQTRCIPDPDGVLSPEDIEKRMRKRDLHAPATSLICMENAHSTGRVVSLEHMDTIHAIAGKRKLPVHLDGARIFNAAAALGCGAQDIAARADSVMVCLSKGLCAPVGSLLAGTQLFIDEARLKRKVMGGGLRQAGVLAAAGIIALEKHTGLLTDDHRRTRKLAQGLANINGLNVNLDSVDINMVFFTHSHEISSEKIVKQFFDRGIVIHPPDNGVYRFVTHYWIGDREIEMIIFAAGEIFK
ncbi:MAG: aminotransferase class I/II-fold pyridoxal phosphate-dependent enzyme [Treponema sp.]|nr:aminotransferase class I/II-fold pyridoxal phosphate-dependent enzyme [Treponema sp.]